MNTSTMSPVLEFSVSLPRSVALQPKQPIREISFEKPTVENNLRLAYSCTLSFLPSNQDVQDSDEYSNALVGLWKATQTWTYALSREYGCTWSTYAIRCMRNEIVSGLRQNSRYQEKSTDFDKHQPESPFKESIADLFDARPGESPSEKRAKKILYDYYIMNKTLVEIGQEYNIKKGRVQQIVQKAIVLLRKQTGVAPY